MSDVMTNQYLPDFVSPPGETLEEILQERGMPQAELADRTGRPKKTINEIIKGKVAITPETALQFEKVLGVPASFWMVREQQYREALARAKEASEFEASGEWLEEVPYRTMAKLGWVRQVSERSRQVEELLRFFAVANPASWQDLWTASAVYRQSPSFQSAPGAVAAWLRRGEIDAQKRDIRSFDEAIFRTVLERIRSLTRDIDSGFQPVIERECAAAGVCVVFVPELPGTHLWGATRWLTPSRPLIQLSLRYKKDDHLWFTFFHEAAHILLHGRRDVFLEDEEEQSSDAKEREADAFARDFLIPAPRYRMFCRLGAFSCAAASRFAYELGIAPGIVIGRLQHDGYLHRAHCNELKRDVQWLHPREGDNA